MICLAASPARAGPESSVHEQTKIKNGACGKCGGGGMDLRYGCGV